MGYFFNLQKHGDHFLFQIENSKSGIWGQVGAQKESRRKEGDLHFPRGNESPPE